MPRALPLLLATLLAAPASALTLDDLRWERRLVLAYGEPEGTEMRRLQALAAERSCAVAERDLAIYRVRAGRGVPLTPGAEPLDDPRLETLGSGKRPFGMVLVGKDGGVKARGTTADALGDLLDRIDAMPMRRREMATRGSVCPDR